MMCTPGWDIVTLCEVPEVVSLIFAEATVTRYPLGGTGDGAVQMTCVSLCVLSALKSFTAPPPGYDHRCLLYKAVARDGHACKELVTLKIKAIRMESGAR